MSSKEYIELKEQLDRIEQLLMRQMTSSAVLDIDQSSVAPPPASSVDLPDGDNAHTAQAEGRYILETQGMEAYKAFWKQQGKKRKPRMKRAA